MPVHIRDLECHSLHVGGGKGGGEGRGEEGVRRVANP